MQDNEAISPELDIPVVAARTDLSATDLFAQAIANDEGMEGPGGSLLVRTGAHTGRSPADKFIVKSGDALQSVCWNNNKPMEASRFDQLKTDMINYARSVPMYRQDLRASCDPAYSLHVRLFSEWAWHALFLRNLLLVPDHGTMNLEADFTIVNCPGFLADPSRHGCCSETVIAFDFEQRLVLIGGTGYGGENKKSVFTLLNHILPVSDVLPMHCSANHARENSQDSALFFGLSGTGKTTLSSDPNRVLIGDDEHGWSDQGIFNFEGGCYAKTLNLDPLAEPSIHAASMMPGTILENVFRDSQTGKLDYFNSSITENGRCAYSIESIADASMSGQAGHPRNLFMLTCDVYGVLPALARLSPAQAEYYFLSGFTSKLAGTERGVSEPRPVFSACFGQPFLTRPATEYGRLLRRRLSQCGTACWLVNTGWTGGGFGVGHRMPIASTRALLASVHDGKAQMADFRRDQHFGFDVPMAIEGVENSLLDPRAAWESKQEFDRTKGQLVAMFCENFRLFKDDVSSDVAAAIPGIA